MVPEEQHQRLSSGRHICAHTRMYTSASTNTQPPKDKVNLMCKTAQPFPGTEAKSCPNRKVTMETTPIPTHSPKCLITYKPTSSQRCSLTDVQTPLAHTPQREQGQLWLPLPKDADADTMFTHQQTLYNYEENAQIPHSCSHFPGL